MASASELVDRSARLADEALSDAVAHGSANSRGSFPYILVERGPIRHLAPIASERGDLELRGDPGGAVVVCSCGWSRECISGWAADSVAKLHPKLSVPSIEHTITIEEPPAHAPTGTQLPLT